MNIHKYDDIIHLQHPTSKTHKRMPIVDRAAQFAPFAALTGHQEQIKESGRLTQEKKILDENQKAELDYHLQTITPTTQVKIVYFVPDLYKSGGKYVAVKGYVKKIDDYERVLILKSKQKIKIDDIYSIEIISFSNSAIIEK